MQCNYNFLRILGIVYILNIILSIHTAYGCGIRWPQLSTPEIDKKPEADFDSTYSQLSNESENKLKLIKTQNAMMSVTLKYIVDFIIDSGGLEFSCPKPNGTFGAPLDCHKYYNCQNSTPTEKNCDPDKGFSNYTLSCISKDDVPLCSVVEIQPDFNCTSNGLHTYVGDCSKFVICTKKKIAYAASCNKGDFFDQNLLICLPNTEAVC